MCTGGWRVPLAFHSAQLSCTQASAWWTEFALICLAGSDGDVQPRERAVAQVQHAGGRTLCKQGTARAGALPLHAWLLCVLPGPACSCNLLECRPADSQEQHPTSPSTIHCSPLHSSHPCPPRLCAGCGGPRAEAARVDQRAPALHGAVPGEPQVSTLSDECMSPTCHNVLACNAGCIVMTPMAVVLKLVRQPPCSPVPPGSGLSWRCPRPPPTRPTAKRRAAESATASAAARGRCRQR